MGKHTTQQPHNRLPTPRRSPRRTQKTNRRTRPENRQTHPNPRRTPTRQRPRNRLHPLTRPLARQILRNHRRRRLPRTQSKTKTAQRTPRPHLPPLTQIRYEKAPAKRPGLSIFQTDHVKIALVQRPFPYVISLKGRTYKPVLSSWKPLYSTPAAGILKSVTFGFT